MTKHVFNVSYGYLYCRGEFVKETASTITYRVHGSSRERRVFKGAGTIVVDTENPDATEQAWRDEWAKHAQAIKRCEDELKELRKKRDAAAMIAIGFHQEERS